MEIDPHLPVDKTAALVVAKSKDQGLEHKCRAKIVSMSPLPTTFFNGPKKDDLTGRKSGRFTVIGCALWRPSNHKTSANNTRWVVRCSCGRYQMLTSKAVKKNHPNTMCVECERNYTRTAYEPKRLLVNAGLYSIFLLLILSFPCTAQTVLLPTWVADSLIYETTKGRACANVMEAQANEIEKLGTELMHTNKALDLKDHETQTLEGLLENSKKGNEVLGMQFALDKKKLKRKVRNRNLLILGESVVIVLLISTL